MLLKAPKGLQKPSDVEFKDYTTWIQCHNLPIACMNPETVRRIGETVGKVEEIDIGESGNCLGQYARVRVTRDVEKPLQRCVKITLNPTAESQTILIRYERLPEYCAACGRVDHVVRHCTDNTVDKTKKAFGPWLKAVRTMTIRRRREGKQENEMVEQSQRSAIKEHNGKEDVPGDESTEEDLQVSERQPRIIQAMDTDKENESNMEVHNEQEEKEDGEVCVEQWKENEKCDRSRGLVEGDGGDRRRGKGIATPRRSPNTQPQEKSKRWKRRAREMTREGQHVFGNNYEGTRSNGVKRKLPEVAWPNLQHNSKSLKSTTETEATNELTAATAGQSRRDQ